MHADEVATDVELVRRLLRDQFPAVGRAADHSGGVVGHRPRDLPARGRPGGPDAEDRVGASTRQTSSAPGSPACRPCLPVRVPEHVGAGVPGHGYPFTWSVVTWLPGRPADADDRSSDALVDDLAEVVRSLRAYDDPEIPVRAPGQRGGLIAAHDGTVREAIAELGDRIDAAGALRVWDEAVEAGPPAAQVPSHGDLLPGNLLIERGRLAAVIDWGGFGLRRPGPRPAAGVERLRPLGAASASATRSRSTPTPGHAAGAGPCSRRCSRSPTTGTPTPGWCARRRTPSARCSRAEFG